MSAEPEDRGGDLRRVCPRGNEHLGVGCPEGIDALSPEDTAAGWARLWVR